MKKTWVWGLLPSIIVFAMLMQGCGQNKALTPSAGSFGEAAGSLPSKSGSSEEVPAKTGLAEAESASTGVPSQVQETEKAGDKVKEEDPTAEEKKAASPEEKKAALAPLPKSASEQPEDLKSQVENKPDGRTNSTGGAVSAKEQTTSKELKSTETQTKVKAGTGKDSNAVSGKATANVASTKPDTSQGNKAASGVKDKKGAQPIGWSQFFDGDDQTTPSEAFWDLSGSTVTIKGFMGEVLSFENNWFLLIPEPGAECPFDNGDETYWNKIMIVFVPEDVKLRYKSEPLEITGRLDVGIKIDESGYKTMFRLYDASFKEIKE